MKLVAISGMHRSGTSLVARVANLLGLDLGDASDLLEPKPDNPRGFWESGTITGFNDDLLSWLGGRWDDPPLLEDGWESAPELDDWRARAGDLLGNGLGTSQLRGWKDPRMSILGPFWGTVADFAPGIISIRRPAEVAASLESRNQFDAETAGHLWLRYVVGAIRSERAALVVRYSGFFDDLETTVSTIADHLGVAPPSTETRQEISEFVTPDLRHHIDVPDAHTGQLGLAHVLFETIGSGREYALADGLHAFWVAAGNFEIARNRIGSLEQERTEIIEHRDDLITQRDIALGQRDEYEQRLRESADHRDDLVNQRDVAIGQRDQAVDHRDDIIRQRDEAIRQRDETVDHRDDIIRQRDEAIRQRDGFESRLENAERALVDAEQHARTRDAIQRKNLDLLERAGDRLRRECADLESKLRSTQEELQRARQELEIPRWRRLLGHTGRSDS